MKRKVKTALIVVGVVVLIPVLLFVGYWALLIFSQGISLPPTRYELPPGYRGWVVVQFDDPNCPAMRSKGIYQVISISASGRGCTSNRPPKGWSYNPVVYVNADGSRKKVEAHFTSNSADGKWSHFFVGTQAELDKSWSNEPQYERESAETEGRK
jgi:hypothetical protein